eukprot:Em0019g47a
MLVATFADNKQPPVYEAVKVANVPYHKAFKFNNSALYSPNDDRTDLFDSMFWEMGRQSFSTFFAEFVSLKPQSLNLTREVLKERDTLETTLRGLQPQIQLGLSKIDVLNQERCILQRHEAQINETRYKTAVGGKTKLEKLIAGMEKEMQTLVEIVHGMMDDARMSIRRLKEIALKPNPMSEVEYLDLLIESESIDCASGFQERIQVLKKFKKQAELLSKLANTPKEKKGWREQFIL